MSISYFKLGLVAAVLAASAGAANAQFTTNGSFTGIANGTYTGTTTLTSGTNTIANWSSNGSVTMNTQAMTIGEGGTAAVKLLPNTFTSISPNFDYTLSFSYSGTNNRNAGTAFQQETIGFWKLVTDTTPFDNLVTAGATVATAWSTDAAGGTGTSGTLTETNTGNYSATFRLNGATDFSYVYLVFQGYDNNIANGNNSASSLTIDNVSAVPEPESYAMFAAGIGAIGFMSRRRKNFS